MLQQIKTLGMFGMTKSKCILVISNTISYMWIVWHLHDDDDDIDLIELSLKQ
jgi:hypothetical protein